MSGNLCESRINFFLLHQCPHMWIYHTIQDLFLVVCVICISYVPTGEQHQPTSGDLCHLFPRTIEPQPQRARPGPASHLEERAPSGGERNRPLLLSPQLWWRRFRIPCWQLQFTVKCLLLQPCTLWAVLWVIVQYICNQVSNASFSRVHILFWN